MESKDQLFMNRRTSQTSSIFKNLIGIAQLVRETLQQKRMNLLGCKMKIYQERLRQIQFLEIISRYKAIYNIENIYTMDKTDLMNKLDFCE